MNKDALITELDVDGLNTEIQSKHLYNTVRDFLEGEPHLSYVMGMRIGVLSDALDQAGVSPEQRENIIEIMHLTLGINMYLMCNATKRLLNDLMPMGEADGAS